MDIILPVLFNFTALVVILWWFTRKPAAKFLVDRSDKIAASITEAETLATQADADLQKWEQSWKTCEAQSKEMFDEAKANLVKYKENSLTRARNEATRIRTEGELVGQSERQKALQRIQRELVEESVSMAEQYLTANLRDEDRHKLVTEYVEMIGNGKA